MAKNNKLDKNAITENVLTNTKSESALCTLILMFSSLINADCKIKLDT